MLLTTATVTSARLARTRLPKGVLHQYVPLDNQAFVQRFLRHWRPDLAVLVESEIWPNLVLETKARDIPLLLINGRMSTSSFKRWRRRPGLSRPIFSSFDLVLAQNDRLAERFAQLGVGARARRRQSQGRRAAASGRPAGTAQARRRACGPHGVACREHPSGRGRDRCRRRICKMRVARPDLLTIIVPRHPGARAADRRAAAAPRASTSRCARRASCPRPTTDIYVADTIGELGLFYALVAGRLCRRLARRARRAEPGRADQARRRGADRSQLAELPRFLCARCLRAGGCKRGRATRRASPRRRSTLLEDASARRTMTERASRAIAAMSGALPRTLAELEHYLPPKTTLQHAS